MQKIKTSAVNKVFNKVVAAIFALLGANMLVINLVVYGNLIPAWIIALTALMIVFIPVTKVIDTEGVKYLSFWGVNVKRLG